VQESGPVLLTLASQLSATMGDCNHYIHRIRTDSFLEPLLHRQYSRRSESEFMDVLQSEEYYRILREKEMNEQDRLAIQEFVSGTLTRQEWDEFQKHCLENQIDPYEEIRELIYSSYAKMANKR